MNPVQSPPSSNRLPNEIQIDRLRIAGLNTASVLYALAPFLQSTDRPDFSLITRPVKVYLEKTALSLNGFEPSNAAVLILNLETDPLLSAASKQPLSIRWFCQSDPREYVGPSLDHFRGTYFRHKGREMVYSSDSDTEVYSLSEDRKLTWQLAVAVCILHEGGVPESRIRLILESSVQNRRVRTCRDDP